MITNYSCDRNTGYSVNCLGLVPFDEQQPVVNGITKQLDITIVNNKTFNIIVSGFFRDETYSGVVQSIDDLSVCFLNTTGVVASFQRELTPKQEMTVTVCVTTKKLQNKGRPHLVIKSNEETLVEAKVEQKYAGWPVVRNNALADRQGVRNPYYKTAETVSKAVSTIKSVRSSDTSDKDTLINKDSAIFSPLEPFNDTNKSIDLHYPDDLLIEPLDILDLDDTNNSTDLPDSNILSDNLLEQNLETFSVNSIHDFALLTEADIESSEPLRQVLSNKMPQKFEVSLQQQRHVQQRHVHYHPYANNFANPIAFYPDEFQSFNVRTSDIMNPGYVRPSPIFSNHVEMNKRS